MEEGDAKLNPKRWMVHNVTEDAEIVYFIFGIKKSLHTILKKTDGTFSA